jgi:predicted dithiol-disulfide oxidoreductase (DUF899 family)
MELPKVVSAEEGSGEREDGEPARSIQGRRQLFVYNFMFGPNQDVGCDGCSMVVDQLTHLAHLHARSTRASRWFLVPR